jgi:hypothetical protein
MRDSPVVVVRSQLIDALPERVWSLLSSAEAWSLRPTSFAFDVTAPAGSRLRVVLGLSRAGPICGLYAISGEVPGQAVSLHALGTPPSGRERLTLSVAAQGRGVQATIMVSSPVTRANSRADLTAYWQEQLETWLGNLRAVIEGQRPWPATGMDPALRSACSPRAPLASPAEVSASALVRAPIDQVWQAIYAPESGLLTDPRHMICAGQVPGTPTHQVGEMQYFVRREDDGRLWASACAVTELTDQHSALTASLTPPHIDVLHLVTPAQQGTQLQLTIRCPARTAKSRALRRHMTNSIQADVDGYKKLIESADRG